jgi:hypothetical protein
MYLLTLLGLLHRSLGNQRHQDVGMRKPAELMQIQQLP